MLLPSSPERKVEERPLTPQLALRVAVLGMLGLATFGVLLFRLWALQVLASARYQHLAQQTQVRSVRIPATRGSILDANGFPLVRNRVSLDVKLDMNVLRTRAQVRRVLHLLQPLKIGVTVKRGLRLVDAGVKYNALAPVTVAKDVPVWVAEYLAERSWTFRGVTVDRDVVREYPQHFVGAHIFGQIYEISGQQLKEARYNGYRPGDEIGQSGVEQEFDRWLRGTDGLLQVPVDAGNRPVGSPIQKPAPVPGFNVRLTIRRKLQAAAEGAVHWAINQSGTADSGALVAIDVHTGAVLAMASLPGYDPNWFTERATPKVDAHLRVLQNPGNKLKPLYDRTISWPYPAGSTFKPFTAVAGMQTHLVSADTPLLCSPDFKVAGGTFKNWDPYFDAPLTLYGALVQSCDSYFYRLANDIYYLPGKYGHPLQRWARRFGFGKPTGIDLPNEIGGTVPDQAWKFALYKTPSLRRQDPNWEADEQWHPGDELHMAIGQGDLQMTPMQLAVAYAAIANGGKIVTPHVVQDVERPGRSPITFPHPTHQIPVDPAVLAAIRDGLHGVTHDPNGTGYAVFSHFAVDVSGKTGTAEVQGKPNTAVFASYAPANNPQIAVVAIINGGGHGGVDAAPAVMRFYAKYFHAVVPNTGTVQDQSR